MEKIKIGLLYCNMGDVLAEDVIGNNGIKIVTKDTILNEYIKAKLFDMGIENIWVYSRAFNNAPLDDENKNKTIKANYIKAILTIKEVLNNLAMGERLDYVKITEISNNIYSEIGTSNLVLKYLNELRDFDEYTYTHSINTGIYAMLLAKWCQLPEQNIKEVINAGILHDIGKINVPEEIIKKSSRLTNEEYEEIKNHTIYGYDIVNSMECIDNKVKLAILMHHERNDGSGYPFRYKNDNISSYAKIIAICDVYDAITSDRVYKERKTPFEAFEFFMGTGIGTFDVTLLKIFLSNLMTNYIGANVKLSNGNIGQIVYIPPQDIISPIINVNTRFIDFSKEKELRIINFV
jgi:putative nucleotidyltransferase with HDIG domain